MTETIITNARLVLPDAVMLGSLAIEWLILQKSR